MKLRNTVTMSVVAAGLACFASGQSTDTTQQPTQAAPKDSTAAADQPPPGVPKNATRVDAYRWRAKDEKGISSIYKKTPFGIMKFPDMVETKKSAPEPAGHGQAADTSAAAKPDDKTPDAKVIDPKTSVAVIATDQGDSVKFEKKTPFGPHIWTTKKTQLSDDEKQWFADSTARTQAGQKQK